MPDESLKPPDGLETAGKQLWDSVTATFVLNAGETEILRQACRPRVTKSRPLKPSCAAHHSSLRATPDNRGLTHY